MNAKGQHLTRHLTPLRHMILLVLLTAGLAQAQQPGEAPSFAARTGHVHGIASIAVSADKGLILTGSADNVAKLWDVKTGALLRTFAAPTGYVRGLRNDVTAVAMTSAANTILIGSSVGVHAWDGRTGKLTATVVQSDHMVKALVMNSAGDLAVVSGTGAANGGARAFLSVHRKGPDDAWTSLKVPLDKIFYSIDSLVLNGDGTRIGLAGTVVSKEVTGGVETVPFYAIWSVEGDAPIVPRLLNGGRSYSDTEVIGFASDGTTLILSDRAIIYRYVDGDDPLVRIGSGHVAALSPDGKLLAVAQYNDTGETEADYIAAELHDLVSGTLITTIGWPDIASEKTNNRTLRLAFVGPEKLVIGFNSGKLAVWDRTGHFDWIVQPRESGPAGFSILDRNGRMLLLAQERQILAFDLHTGAEILLENPSQRTFGSVTLSPDGERAAAGGNGSGLHVWNTRTGALLYEHPSGFGGAALSFSWDGRHIALASRGGPTGLIETETGAEVAWRQAPKGAAALAFSPDGSLLAAGDGLGEVHFVPLSPGARAPAPLAAPWYNASVEAVAFEATGHKIAVGYGNGYNRLIIYDLQTGDSVATEQLPGWINALSFDEAGRRVATVGQDQRVSIWDAQTGTLLDFGEHKAIARGVGLSSNGRRAATYADGGATLWSLSPEGHLTKLLELIDLNNNWVAVRDDGRFDTGNPEALQAVAWLMPDDPLRPLAADTYLRDYFEPNLLPRFLGCIDDQAIEPHACLKAFPTIPSVQSLNRIPPVVNILDVQAGATPDTAVVRVRATGAEDKTQTNEKWRTDAYDLRLFRDGQLVGRCPRSGSGKVSEDCSTFPIRIPHRQGPVHLSAYAFNEDRVRSAVDTRDYPSPSPASGHSPKAYVITIGVNAYANAEKNLSYAAKDARDMARALRKIDGYKVVPLTLISEVSGVHGATGAQIEAVLAALAGRSFNRGLIADVPGSADLAEVTPDDLVILTFSGHGYTSSDGGFFLLPSDSQPGLDATPERVARYISSQQLRDWLEPIDAGQLIMIIDACHSAASVATPGFKPGPMGDAGLGQLAYDKGMRLLAATQVDEVAIETEGLQQGLLTYALLQLGLGQDGGSPLADRDHDERITLTEWLRYGEMETPALYRKARNGAIKLVRKNSAPDPRFINLAEDQGQTPALFDFYRGPEDPIIGFAGER